MSLARFAKKRDGVERSIIDALRLIGGLVSQLDRPADLLVGYHGRWIVLEVKDPDARPRKEQVEQREFIELAQRDGLPIYYVTTAEDALNAVAGLHVPGWH